MDSIEDELEAQAARNAVLMHENANKGTEENTELSDLCWFIENGHSLIEIKAYAREVLRQLGEL